MQGSWNLDAVAAAFTAAAVDSSRWVAAMETVTAATGSFGTILVPGCGRLPRMPHCQALGEATEAYLRDGWVHRDERYRGIPHIVRRGVATDLDFSTPDEMRRHPYYQEFLAPFGLRWSGLVKMAAGDDLWVLSIQRSIAQGPFTQNEITKLRILSKKLTSAVALARTLNFARAEAALEAFEVSGSAAALFDHLGQMVRANAAAERLFGPDLQVRHRRLISFDHAATVAIDQALHQLLWTRGSSALVAPVVLPRHGRRPLLAYPVRLASVTSDAFATCQAILVLIDLDARPRLSQEHLRATFGVTAAETRLAMLLAAGETLDTAADMLGISKETARVQLKALFLKIGVHRQGDLVVLLSRLLSNGEIRE